MIPYHTFEEYDRSKRSKALLFYAKWQCALTLVLMTALILCSQVAFCDSYVVRTIAYEGSNQTFLGQKMISGVIKQRMKERNRTSKQVVLRKSQFSCWKNGKPTQKRRLKAKELSIAKRAWKEGKAEGYNHYCRYDVKPFWIKSAKRSKRIGSHIFYKL